MPSDAEIQKILSPRDEFKATKCDCPGCRVGCRTMPASLIPGDLERIAKHVGADYRTAWLGEHFLASDGAKLKVKEEVVSIPTLVPAQRPDGSCVFLGPEGCTIHPVAPYGCTHSDIHMSDAEALDRSRAAIISQAMTHPHGVYQTAWHVLANTGHMARPLVERRMLYELEFAKVMNANGEG